MATIIVEVPDGDTCKGCEYLDYHCYETSYQCYEECYCCQIFKCKVKDRNKCVACKLLCKR